MSLKDKESDLNINGKKWDFIFDFLVTNTDHFYFLGERLWVQEIRLDILINGLSERNIYISDEYSTIFFKLNASNLLLSRNRLSELWHCYEYPAIFFVQKQKRKR
jgi:hypothetical protein